MVLFRDAAKSYVEHGGEDRYLNKILKYIGDKDVTEIFPFDIKVMADTIYANCSNATKNRQVITPMRAVIIHAYERGWCNYIRIRNYKVVKTKNKNPASVVWMHLFLEQCKKDNLPHLAALVLFMNQTAARVSEATSLKWSEVDISNRKVLLLKTKTDVNVTRHLTDELVTKILELERLNDGSNDYVFRYTSRYGVNDRIEAVCRRAKIPYKTSHEVGRHSFATNAISMGVDVRTAMDAGGWKCSSVFLETYVHPKNSSKIVANIFNGQNYDNIF